jgi:hypothetical protein
MIHTYTTTTTTTTTNPHTSSPRVLSFSLGGVFSILDVSTSSSDLIGRHDAPAAMQSTPAQSLVVTGL